MLACNMQWVTGKEQGCEAVLAFELLERHKGNAGQQMGARLRIPSDSAVGLVDLGRAGRKR